MVARSTLVRSRTKKAGDCLSGEVCGVETESGADKLVDDTQTSCREECMLSEWSKAYSNAAAWLLCVVRVDRDDCKI